MRGMSWLDGVDELHYLPHSMLPYKVIAVIRRVLGVWRIQRCPNPGVKRLYVMRMLVSFSCHGSFSSVRSIICIATCLTIGDVIIPIRRRVEAVMVVYPKRIIID